MKRKIGLLMTVLFALTLTSQTILALDHDPFDPRYNGDYNKSATKDGDPWIECNNNSNNEWFRITVLDNPFINIFNNIFLKNYYNPPVIIIIKEKQSKNDRNENEETGSQEVREGTTPPSNM